MSALFPVSAHARRSRPALAVRIRSLFFATIPALVLALIWFYMGQWYHGRLLMREYGRVQSLATQQAAVLEWALDHELALIKSAALEDHSPVYWSVFWSEAPSLSEDGRHLKIRLRVEDTWGQGYLVAQHLPIEQIMRAAGLRTLARWPDAGCPGFVWQSSLWAKRRCPGTGDLSSTSPGDFLVAGNGARRRLVTSNSHGTVVAARRDGRLFLRDFWLPRTWHCVDTDVWPRVWTWAAEALRLSEASFRHVFESVPDPLLVATLDGALVEANGQAKQRFGLDIEWPATVADLLSTHGYPGDAALCDLQHLQNDVSLLPLQVSGHGTTRCYFEITTTEFAAGLGDRRLLIVLHDVTTQHLGEQALRASEARYKSLVENSPEGILLLNLDGRLSVANRQAAELAGYAGPDSLLRSVHRFGQIWSPSQSENGLSDRLLSALSEGAVRGEAFALVHRGGKQIAGRDEHCAADRRRRPSYWLCCGLAGCLG